jgi:hypothetical protein
VNCNLTRVSNNSDAERKAIRESKLRGHIAERNPVSLMTVDQKIAAFKAQVDGSDDDEDNGDSLSSRRITNLAGEYVMRCEGGKDCKKSVCHVSLCVSPISHSFFYVLEYLL